MLLPPSALIYKVICVIILGHAEHVASGFVSVAQGTEHRSPKAGVGGSNPLWDTTAALNSAVFLFAIQTPES